MEDSTFKIDGSKTVDFTSTYNGDQTFKVATAMTSLLNGGANETPYVYVAADDHKVNIDVTAKDDAIGAGILLQSSAKSYLSFTHSSDTEINVKGAEGNTQKSYGIWRAITDATGKNLTVQNQAGLTDPKFSINVENANGGYGIAISRPEDFTLPDNTKTYKNTSMLTLGYVLAMPTFDIKVSENKNATDILDESAGLYADTNSSSIRIYGATNLDVEGHGILVTGVEGSTQSGPTITVSKGGKITVRPDADGAERYSIYNEKGTVNFGAGNTSWIVMGGTQIDGDIYMGNGTSLNLGLYGKGSYFKGAIKEDGTPSTLEMKLNSDATWTNVATNEGNLGIDSKLTKLSGVGGVLHQTKDSGKVTIDELNSKYFSIAYDHDASDPTKILGSDVTVTKAQADSVVNVFTDYDENMSTEEKQRAVLEALAKKLYYTNYVSGETNLSAKVSIAEGLTASSVSKYYADMSFDATTGQGYLDGDTQIETLTVADHQTKAEFTDFVSTNPLYITPYIESGVYKNDTYTFTEDTKFTFDDNLPVVTGGSWLTSSMESGIVCENGMSPVIFDMNGHNLEISQETTITQAAIMSIGVDSLVEINNPGATKINVTSNKGAMTAALFAIWGGKIFIHNGGPDQDQKVLVLRGSTTRSTNGAVVKTINEVSGAHSYIKVDGLIDILADTTNGVGMAEGLSAVASTIEVGGGKIIMTASGENPGVNYGGGAANNAIRAYGEFVSGNTGIVNVNVIKDEDSATGTAIAAGNNPVQISGDFSTVGGMGTKGTINVGLNTPESYWVGNYKYGSGWGVTPGDYGVLKLFMGNKARWMGYAKYATKLKMDSGAEWEGYSESNAVDATIQNGAIWHNYNDSTSLTQATLQSLTGGTSAATAGYIDMTRAEKETVIGTYAGQTNVFYAHDASDPTSITGADLVINKAESASNISLITDNMGVDTTTKDSVINVLNALAGKLYYSEYVNGTTNLSGLVKIADGLTSSSQTLETGEIEFQADKEGKGKYKEGTLNPDISRSNITEGEYETFAMKGVRSAATTMFHAWRDNMQDTYRGADLADEDGIFAKVYGGKTESDVKSVHETNTYKGAQIGYDKAMKNGWHAGVAFDYRDGDSDYLLGGKGEDKLYSFGVYGVKKLADNSYFRIAAKAGHVSNKYDVYTEYRLNSLHGDYGVAAYGLTAEYGKTFASESSYITPKLQLTWAHVGGEDYTGVALNGTTMKIYQDAYQSFVGRLGVEVGTKQAKGSFYGGLYLAHEFSGDINARYYAKNGGWKSTSFDGNDTWVELVIGGQFKAGDRAKIYADFARDFSGDFEHQWKLDAGVRLSF